MCLLALYHLKALTLFQRSDPSSARDFIEAHLSLQIIIIYIESAGAVFGLLIHISSFFFLPQSQAALLKNTQRIRYTH